MSASLRTAQRPLGVGIGRIGGAIFAVIVAVVIAAALMLGQLSTTKAPAVPAGAGSGPQFIDHAKAESAPGAPVLVGPQFNDHVKAETAPGVPSVITDSATGHSGYAGDPGLAPQSAPKAGTGGPRMQPQ